MQRITVPNKVLLLEVTRLLDEGQIVILRVKGNSMLPFIIGDRDSVVLQKARLLQPGDIVFSTFGGRPLCASPCHPMQRR